MFIIEKPVKLYAIEVLYLILGVFVIIAYIYLVITDYSIFTFGGFNAGDTTYTDEMVEIVVKFGIAPSLFIGGLIALPGAILSLSRDDKKGYYLMLISSGIWSLPLIGLIGIALLLQEDVKSVYLR